MKTIFHLGTVLAFTLTHLSAQVIGEARTTAELLSVSRHGKSALFVLEDAKPVADLETGGFTTEPALAENFNPG
ncbi:hypothetical protein P0Y35_04455 [Kiritimatiellaeota bacterium B1221]|nr:hypothetical protein [Kiritimatiellaeota bacterium B1221]